MVTATIIFLDQLTYLLLLPPTSRLSSIAVNDPDHHFILQTKEKLLIGDGSNGIRI